MSLTRMELRKLLKNGEITEDEFNKITKEKDELQKKKNRETEDPILLYKKTIEVVKAGCNNECGRVLNGGTYGLIFEDINNPHRVIKGSRLGHAELNKCPYEFQHEINMYDLIKDVFPSNLKYIKMTTKYKQWTANRHCYYTMDKLEPIHIKKQREIKDELAQYVMDELTDPLRSSILMLVPGVIPEFTKSYTKIEAGIGSCQWREINLPIMKYVFKALDMDVSIYLEELRKVLNVMRKNNIVLSDVEFILAQTENQGVGIYMIDFDKTYISKEKSEFRNLLQQDMFPVDFKLSL